MSGDPFFNDVELLLHCDGSDASTTFTDDSDSGLTVTANGNAHIDTAQSKYGGASALFDGTGDYLSVASFPAIGTSDFTIEFWVRPNTSGVTDILLDFRPSSTEGDYLMLWREGSSKGIRLYVDSSDRISSSTATNVDTWYHVAVERDSGTTTLYIDGTSEGTWADSTNYLTPAGRPYIGISGSSLGGGFSGHIDDLRITVGSALYQGDFTPPAAAHPDFFGFQAIMQLPSVIGATQLVLSNPLQARLQLPSPIGSLQFLAENTNTLLSLPTPLGAPQLVLASDFSAAVVGLIPYYIMVVEGSPELRIPISSWQSTLQVGAASYLQAVIPSASSHVANIAARQGANDFVIYRATLLNGAEVKTELARVPLDFTSYSRGPTNNTMTIYGYGTSYTANANPDAAYDRTLTGIRSINTDASGKMRVRSEIDWYLRPAQRAWADGNDFIVAYINYYVTSSGDAYMDVGDR